MKRKHLNSENNNDIPLKKKNTLSWYFEHMKKINEQKKQKRFLKPKSKDDIKRIKNTEKEFNDYLNRLNEEDRIWEQYMSDDIFNIDFVNDEYFTVNDITTIDISEYLINGYIKYINWSKLNTIDEFLNTYYDSKEKCNSKSNYIEFVGTYNGYIIESNPENIDYKNNTDISANTELKLVVNNNTIIKGYFINPENTESIDFNEYDILQLGYTLTINENCILEIPCNIEILNTVYINGTLKCIQTFIQNTNDKNTTDSE